ncbi:MAG: hypothetical protein ABII06_16145 [Pseudomonadota bacterium]
MKVMIKSNFIVPGLEEGEFLEIDRPEMTLRECLEELARRSPDPLEYVEPGADRLDPDDWEADINDRPYQNTAGGLETVLVDGDTVTIRILAQGGG